MSNDIIKEWLSKYQLPLQELSVKYNTPLGEVMEITELYLLINCTTDVMHLYSQLEWYGNRSLQQEISDLICATL